MPTDFIRCCNDGDDVINCSYSNDIFYKGKDKFIITKQFY